MATANEIIKDLPYGIHNVPCLAGTKWQMLYKHLALRENDWIPSGFAVWSEPISDLKSELVVHGTKVTLTGRVQICEERDYGEDGLEIIELEYREVILESGFTGFVTWFEVHPDSLLGGFVQEE